MRPPHPYLRDRWHSQAAFELVPLRTCTGMPAVDVELLWAEKLPKRNACADIMERCSVGERREYTIVCFAEFVAYTFSEIFLGFCGRAFVQNTAPRWNLIIL